ncbi:MAG: dephospho-CoA kinase [Hydrogenibacillus sp.]|nr:dephospho-CoA kinase [Hydrogenibacillus sp.]
MIVGLTGGIASGKSTVSKMLAARGAWVVDADRLARAAVEPGSTALEQIVERFGAGVLQADGTLDRKALGRIVFADVSALKALEAIVHPEVRRMMRDEIAQAKAKRAAIIVLDVPLLFENGLERLADLTVVVETDVRTQIERLTVRDRLPRAEAAARLDAQMPLGEKRALADVVLINRGTIEDLERQVDALWEYLTREMRSAHRERSDESGEGES